jgi:23S rRNA (adenine2503-C2)-methyltransferase
MTLPTDNTSDEKHDIREFDRDRLVQWCRDRDMAPYRAGQILKWIYSRGAASFDEMTDIAKAARQMLADHFVFSDFPVARMETSADGSRKYLFRLKDGLGVESVLIPEKDHYTLCISTQVGCAMGCRFCMTAASGLIRNLTAGEILGQVLAARREVTEDKRLTNIVLMGMGEPLANYEAVIHAVRVMTDIETGLALSTRRVTLSTAGLVPRFAELGKDTRIRLAVSLNAADNATRDQLMPINRTYPLEALIDACARYPLAQRDKITFEYILIKDVNDSVDAARRLSRLLHPVKAKINLIPFNEHPASDFRRPDPTVIAAFQETLAAKNYTAIIRHSKGSDISAACGQLSAANRGIRESGKL